MLDILKLVRHNIYKLTPYSSARKIGGMGHVLLNANESPSNLSYELIHKELNRYPEPQPKKVISKYSLYSGVSTDQILVSRGSDEAIDLLIKTFCEPGKDKIITCPPTYDMYDISAQIYGVKNYIIPMLYNWQLDIEKILKFLNKVKIVFICRPNNPTGNLIKKNVIIDLLKLFKSRTLVVIDEAYIEFCIEKTLASFINKYPNLVILRTLSKAFGLAGIRCGFTLANKKIIELLNKVIAPYPISTPVSNIALEALSDSNVKSMKIRVSEINYNRNFLFFELKKLYFVKNIFPSVANYILVRFCSVQKIFEELSRKGIILRNQDSKINLKGCIRISIGSRDECCQLVKELEKMSKYFK